MSSRAALAVKNAQAYLRSRELTATDEEMPITVESRSSLGAQRQSDLPSSEQEPWFLLDIRCLGRFQLYLEGRLLSPRAFRRHQSLTALKILVTHREQPLTKEQLMEYIWPEADPETTARNLRVVIHDLRRGLASISPSNYPFIIAEDGSYHFNTPALYRLDVDEFVNCVRYLGHRFGGIKLEDIKAPECFIIEQRLREIMDIPVFHDDQHGTAIIVVAGLINALHLTDRTPADRRPTPTGAAW